MATAHQWVEFLYIPLTVEIDEGTGDITTFHEEGAEEIAKENSVEVCWFCHVSLDQKTIDTECPGKDTE